MSVYFETCELYEKQIEKMKCCGNCKHFDVDFERESCVCLLTNEGIDSYGKCDDWKLGLED